MAQTGPEEQEVLRALDFDVEPAAPKISDGGPPPPPVEPPDRRPRRRRPGPSARRRSGRGYFGHALLGVAALMLAVMFMDQKVQRGEDLPIVGVVVACTIVILATDDRGGR